LTSSAIEPSSIGDYTIDELEAVDLNDEATKGLAASQIRYVKSKVIDCNEALGTAGNAIYAAARALVDIKKDVKNKNWKALTDSGVLVMSGRNARDLATAYETWLSNTDIPQDALSQVSARTLAKIGSADAAQRVKAVAVIQEGNGFSEGDLNKIIKKKAKPKTLDEVLEAAKKTAKRKWESFEKEEDKYSEYELAYLENVKVKSENKLLREQLAKAKG
tara:strand:+ start:1792 stop:2448 length:657 start_codon:yes stop_codon:yes gene_type:complete